ncbi:rust resistance kinase Lr10-like [Actinidia eriantha]|uniref:rust resistance kinase Lr10-like n=1 Tax=Actinidia eriantha TaxID=165200 RepID=UPI00258DE066|nr:rust resistance kinase Lr10-like [Actinidia eriantha]
MKLHSHSHSHSRARKMVMFLFLLLLLFQGGLAERDECMPARCGHKGPSIRFPFWLKDHQPQHCGYPHPDFTVSCSPTNKQTLLHYFSLNLSVLHIDYQSQFVKHEKTIASPFLTLPNVSSSRFIDYELYEKYAIFSCPSANVKLSYVNGYGYGYDRITCLSRPGPYYICGIADYTFIMRGLLSCTKMSNISSNYFSLLLSLEDRGSYLSWNTPDCFDCEIEGKYCRERNNSRKHETECFPIPHKPRIGLIPVGVSLLVVVVISTLYFVVRSYNLKKKDQVKIERFLEDYRALKPTRYTYAEIKKITDQLKNEIGQGGYGTVYKGKLSNDIHVAAKILNNFKENGDEFINEVGTIGTIHHVNVVRLVGYCADGYKRALVYEYLPNDSLEKLISSDEKKRSLGWEKLQDIALGIAKGIEYLHQGCDQRIVHFDIKPHNVLLDQNFNPKISDFGLAKLCSKEQSAVSMTAARGTVGYIAPEVFSRNFGNVSHKSDVYSFGMLLLEIVGGRKNTDVTDQNSNEAYFPDWIYNRLNHGEENGIEIEEDEDAKIVKKLTIVGLWCIQWYPGGRPSMKVVVQMLEGDGSTLAMPPSPFSNTNASTSRGNIGGSSFSSNLQVISESE